MGCKFCYATYNTFGVNKQLSIENVKTILLKLRDAGLQKVTFAGGEPMLYKQLDEAIIYAKSIGITTSIITNGSMITKDWLIKMQPYLDWLGLSIDSFDDSTNLLIGRVTRKNTPIDYMSLLRLVKRYDYKLKINTVVNIHNQKHFFADHIRWSGTTRWKVFDTLKVEGQNETQFDNIKSTDFKGFIYRNECKQMVVENNDLMTASYLLIDPLGRFYENWGTNNKKSDSIVTHSVEHCLSQITLDRDKFIARGGIYEW